MDNIDKILEQMKGFSQTCNDDIKDYELLMKQTSQDNGMYYIYESQISRIKADRVLLAFIGTTLTAIKDELHHMKEDLDLDTDPTLEFKKKHDK